MTAPFSFAPPALNPAAPGSPTLDVLIRGGGPVGMGLALALSRDGLRVGLLAAAPKKDTPPDVRTYALNAGSVALLGELRVWDALPEDARTAVHDMRIHGDGGGAIEFSAWQQGIGELAWIVDAAALEHALGEALRYAPHVQRLTQPVAASLTAVCEGKDSATRDALGAGFESFAYGHHGIAARLVSDTPHHGTAWQWFRHPDVLALLPFDRPQTDHGFGLVWSQPQAEAERLLVLSDAEFEAALNEATGGAAGTLRLGSPRSAWPLRVGQAQRWCGPGWVLLGDTAHAVHPLAGQGLNLGLADVRALARVLVEARRTSPWKSLGDERTLRRYARERSTPTRAMSGLTDGLLHLFAQPSAPLKELRNHGMTLVHHLGPLKRWLTARALDA
jgi:2-polyprenyl-6-methoxyphenol hydroxylase-like FAD-dependent oxidoreductase